mmetsp:Transcript_168093/g.539830  ORF Transcript_168093/g.539830 Transcript_168093/m.539830 type:complete len:204 (+) Transcript_168093:1529-2140(+)
MACPRLSRRISATGCAHASLPWSVHTTSFLASHFARPCASAMLLCACGGGPALRLHCWRRTRRPTARARVQRRVREWLLESWRCSWRVRQATAWLKGLCAHWAACCGRRQQVAEVAWWRWKSPESSLAICPWVARRIYSSRTCPRTTPHALEEAPVQCPRRPHEVSASAVAWRGRMRSRNATRACVHAACPCIRLIHRYRGIP